MSDTPSTRPHSQLFLARLVLETVTPLSISTGSPDGVFDSALVRDANDLPAIPATSTAGVLRTLWTQQYGADSARLLFGFQHADQGMASRLHVGWGHLLDSQGRAAVGLLLGDAAKRLHNDALFDDVLSQKDAPVHRNRVRLTHKGAAADAGKFDRSVLPAGHRFALELRLHAAADEAGETWNNLLALFSHPGFRLGGATRAGLGRMRGVKLHTAHFDLRDSAQAHALGELGADPSDTRGLTSQTYPAAAVDHWLAATLELDARNLWRIGQGDAVLGPMGPSDKEPDLLPVTERRIHWSGDSGRVNHSRELLLPASSLKGVLAHRTAFHARRFAGIWAGQKPECDKDGQPIAPPEVQALFGNVKDKPRGAQDGQGWAGCLFIDDTYLPAEKTQRLMHNSIDRFTGGVREHMLFEEQNVFGGQARVHLALDMHRLQAAAAEYKTTVGSIQRAFNAALQDLCEGRLALGARSTSGNGFFRADLPQALTRPWPETPGAQQPEAA